MLGPHELPRTPRTSIHELVGPHEHPCAPKTSSETLHDTRLCSTVTSFDPESDVLASFAWIEKEDGSGRLEGEGGVGSTGSGVESLGGRGVGGREGGGQQGGGRLDQYSFDADMSGVDLGLSLDSEGGACLWSPSMSAFSNKGL